MYCAVCGAESTPGLNYCKRCGSGLGPPANAPDTGHFVAKPFAMLIPVALVSIVGLVGYFVTIESLLDRMIEPRALIAVCAFAAVTVLGVVGLMIWLLLQLSGARPATPVADRGTRPATGSSTQPQLQAPPSSIPSVTENTTRNFDAARLRDRSTSE